MESGTALYAFNPPSTSVTHNIPVPDWPVSCQMFQVNGITKITFVCCDCRHSNSNTSCGVIWALTDFAEEWTTLLIKAERVDQGPEMLVINRTDKGK